MEQGPDLKYLAGGCRETGESDRLQVREISNLGALCSSVTAVLIFPLITIDSP